MSSSLTEPTNFLGVIMNNTCFNGDVGEMIVATELIKNGIDVCKSLMNNTTVRSRAVIFYSKFAKIEMYTRYRWFFFLLRTKNKNTIRY